MRISLLANVAAAVLLLLAIRTLPRDESTRLATRARRGRTRSRIESPCEAHLFLPRRLSRRFGAAWAVLARLGARRALPAARPRRRRRPGGARGRARRLRRTSRSGERGSCARSPSTPASVIVLDHHVTAQERFANRSRRPERAGRARPPRPLRSLALGRGARLATTSIPTSRRRICSRYVEDQDLWPGSCRTPRR